MQNLDKLLATMIEEHNFLKQMQQQIVNNYDVVLDNQKQNATNHEAVISNQRTIINNQEIIVNNQINIVRNQKQIVENQSTLEAILETQAMILAGLNLEVDPDKLSQAKQQVKQIVTNNKTLFEAQKLG